jgi:hypothetical protein
MTVVICPICQSRATRETEDGRHQCLECGTKF